MKNVLTISIVSHIMDTTSNFSDQNLTEVERYKTNNSLLWYQCFFIDAFLRKCIIGISDINPLRKD